MKENHLIQKQNTMFEKCDHSHFEKTINELQNGTIHIPDFSELTFV